MKIINIKKFEKLPFYCGVQNKPYRDNNIPDLLPFTLGISEKDGNIIQILDQKVLDALEDSYKEENIFLTSPMDKSPFSRDRALEFINIMENKAKINIKNKALLEIGCSTGFLLNEFQTKGAIVKGCEPSPSANVGREKYGLDVENDFFKPESYEKKYDIIILATVLEHISNPYNFLNDITKITNQGGKIFIKVPDCERQLEFGDPAMIIHEHWSYFTKDSLGRLLSSVGLIDVNWYQDHKGALYGWGKLEEKSSNIKINPDNQESTIGIDYVLKFDNIISRVNAYFEKARKKGHNIGLYGINTASNLLYLTNWKGVSLKLYDTDPLKYGKYLTCCELEIHSPDELLKDLPESILIIPINFADEIKRYLIDELKIPTGVEIITLNDLLDNNN